MEEHAKAGSFCDLNNSKPDLKGIVMGSSQGIMETSVMESPQIESADGTPRKAQSGFDLVRSYEREETRRSQEELGKLAMRLALYEDVSADEIESTLDDCRSTSGALSQMVDEAKWILDCIAALTAEETDAADLERFQTATANEIRTLWANVSALRKLLAETVCRFHQTRCAVRSRNLMTEKIAASAAGAARELSKIDTSIYGIEVPVRTSAVVRDVGWTPRQIDWFDPPTNSLITRKKAEFLELSAAGKLPLVVPIESPGCMFEPEPVKPAVVVEPSGEPSGDVAALPESTIDNPLRQSAGIEPDDLDDESFDNDQPLDD